MPDTPKQSPVALRAAIAGSAALVIAGLAAFWWASSAARKAPPKAAGQAVTVTIEGKVCTPNEITVPAGRTTFTIVNKSDRALEWEILDGVMVVEERENIAPGFSQTMTVKLQPGTFEITCGLLSNPRGVLRVTPSASSEAEAARPSLVAYVGALAEYRVYLALESEALADAVSALAAAIAAGDLPQARALYGPAHQAYQRIEPMAELFADLDQRLNARAEYFERREADPAFVGFHRLAHGLFAPGQGDTKRLAPVAKQLVADVAELKTRLRTLEVPPERLAAAAAKLLRRTADHLPAGGEDRYRPAEAGSLNGTLEGTHKIAELLSPLLAKAAPPVDVALKAAFADLEKALAPLAAASASSGATGSSGSTVPARPLSDADRQALAPRVTALADAMGRVNAALGLE